MPIISHPEFDGHCQVTVFHDAETGLAAIVALHDLTRGPALGGCRMWPYANEDAALADVLRLSRGMTYKSALAGLSYGGGKSVIIGDPRREKSPALFRAFGRCVDTLGGRYIVAEDVGISVADVEVMARETRHVAGIPARGAGNPSPATAFGVLTGLETAVAHRLGRDRLAGVRVAVQGLGSVGRELCRLLAEAGAELIVTDIHPPLVAEAVRALGARGVAPEEIYRAEAEVFAPCALGAVLNDTTIPALKAKVVAGSANNQLAEARHGAALAARGILYAPDYLINAGGIILISHEGPAFDRRRAFAQVAGIGGTLAEIFARAEATGLTPAEAADRLAEERFRAPPEPESAVA